jgi:hypothetical protein
MTEEVKEKVPECRECVKKIDSPLTYIHLAVFLMLDSILFWCGMIFMKNDMQLWFNVWVVLITVTILADFVWYGVCNIQGTAYYAFLDKHDHLHIHTKEPQYNAEKNVYFSAALIKDKDTAFEDMVIERPILKIMSGGWFNGWLNRNKILGVRDGYGHPGGCHHYGKKTGYNIKKVLFPFASNEFSIISVQVEFSHCGTVCSTPWLNLSRAINVIQSTAPAELYLFLIEKDRHYVDRGILEDRRKMLMDYVSLANANDSKVVALSAIVGDTINLIASWRGSEQSKVGMGARCFLETALKAFSKSPAMCPGSVPVPEITSTFLDTARQAIITEAKNNKVLRRFLETDNLYNNAFGETTPVTNAPAAITAVGTVGTEQCSVPTVTDIAGNMAG